MEPFHLPLLPRPKGEPPEERKGKVCFILAGTQLIEAAFPFTAEARKALSLTIPAAPSHTCRGLNTYSQILPLLVKA